MTTLYGILAITEGIVTDIKTILMVIFFVAFTGLVLWLVFSKSKVFHNAARMPLDDDPNGVDDSTRRE